MICHFALNVHARIRLEQLSRNSLWVSYLNFTHALLDDWQFLLLI